MRCFLASLLLLFAAACSREVPIRADKIFMGGTIYTGVEDGETVQAVAVGDGVVVFTGSLEEAVTASSDGAEIIDLGGATMFPGFTDAHAHLLGIGQRELTLNLDQVDSIEALKAIVGEYRASNPDAEIIFGRGWIETHWPQGRFPNRFDLDSVTGDLPTILTRADGHALVANTAALIAADITSETIAPAGGDILKGDDGEPNGMLIDAAMALALSLVSAPSDSDIRNALKNGMDVYTSRGWTGVHNMSVNQQELNGLNQLSIANSLKLRVYNSVTPSLFERAVNRSPTGPLLTTRAVKIYMDGALGSRGALLLQPYSDALGTSGLALRNEAETKDLFEKALKGEVQLAVHAIGDLGNRRALDWMGDVFESYKPEISEDEVQIISEPRWRIEHAQILDTSDIKRFSQLGVIPSMQPSHAIGDLHFAPSRLGSDRLAGAYAWRSLIDSGTIIAGGSDAPVEVGHPLIEFYAAVERKDLSGFSGDDWNPEQALSRFEALQLFTIWPAFAAFSEDDLGTIELGKKADFSVFSQDLMRVPGNEIMSTKPVMTVVNGDIVWQAD